MQSNWTECVSLKYLILMPDIQEAKCFKFKVQIPPPPIGAPRRGKKYFALRANLAPTLDLFLYTPLKMVEGKLLRPTTFYHALIKIKYKKQSGP